MRAMNSVLIDTSAWIEALRKKGKVEIREHVKSLLLEGQASWNELILAELWNGAQGVAEKKMIRELESDISIFSITKEVWQLTYHLSESARTVGLSVLHWIGCLNNSRVSQVLCAGSKRLWGFASGNSRS